MSTSPAGSARVAVIGAGIVGLAAAHHLAEQGCTVTIYETGQPGFGQSAGQSRIFRHAHDDPRLVDLAIRARRQWLAWEEFYDVPLLSCAGGIALGTSAINRLAILEQHPELRARPVTPDELAHLLPALAPYDGEAVHDPDGGSIFTRAAISAIAGRFAENIVTEQVISLREVPTGVEIRCPTTMNTHDAVVVCAGRGTAPLMRGLGVDIPVTLGAHVRVSFDRLAPASPPPPATPTLPTLQDGSNAFGFSGIYAAAYPDDCGYGLGTSDWVAAHEDGALTDPDALPRFAEQAVEYVRAALPGLDPTPHDIVHCWVTTLPWGDDGVGIWQSGNVVALAGHNLFKHAPVLGEALARTVVDGVVADGFEPEAQLGRSTS